MKTILIIDDDARYRGVMGELLRHHGWQVMEADEGDAGLEMVKRHRPAIVLCDLLMPRGNGFQVCRAIRGDVTLRHTKIVVTSGRDYEVDRIAARDAGADEYLVKPVQPSELSAVLERLSTTPSAPGDHAPVLAGNVAPTQFKFWGVRGSIPTPGPATVRYGGNTSCIEIRAAGQVIILDAGTGLRALGRQLAKEFSGQPLSLTLLLSHTHWDHIQGLPFFAPIYQPNRMLRILGFEGARTGLVNVLSGQMESPYFPVPFGELPGNIQIEELRDMEFQVGPLKAAAWFANHPGVCVGYRVFTPDGSIAFFPDNEPRCRYKGETAVASANPKISLDFAMAEEQKMIEFLRDVDALILDAQYDLEEYEQHVGWGHGCVNDAVALAMKANAKNLFLFHHDPDHDDAKVDAMLAHARSLVTAAGSSLRVEAACEGAVVELSKISANKPRA
ncbi:MAG TPA: response regulator [Verrucomicrobiota bacterium]|nr:response regulator [Verrucomicrobiota bacterium]